jgi:NAD(P)-dependent dehydrogenase (short-subunit alcohol dehydrogenase family)
MSIWINATLPGSGNIVVEAMAKVAVITGGSGMIGQATCRRLAQPGHVAVGIDVGAQKPATGRTTNAI